MREERDDGWYSPSLEATSECSLPIDERLCLLRKFKALWRFPWGEEAPSNFLILVDAISGGVGDPLSHSCLCCCTTSRMDSVTMSSASRSTSWLMEEGGVSDCCDIVSSSSSCGGGLGSATICVARTSMTVLSTRSSVYSCSVSDCPVRLEERELSGLSADTEPIRSAWMRIFGGGA